MRRFYARVEHKVVVGDDLVNLLTVTSPILIRRDSGMKRPGPTFHRLTCTCFIRWLAGVCLSHFSRIGFDEEDHYEGCQMIKPLWRAVVLLKGAVVPQGCAVVPLKQVVASGCLSLPL